MMCGWKTAYQTSHALYEPYLLSQRTSTTRTSIDADGDQPQPTYSYKVTKFSEF